MASRLKEYRYYLSSGVSTGISVKISLVELAPASKSPTKCSNSTIYWNEWISFPVRYRDLSRNSLLAITIWGVGWVPIGGSTISFFTKHGVLRDGVQCLRIWGGQEADSSPNTATPSEINDEWVRQECFRLDKLREKYERKEIPRNEWMDSVTDRRIARIRRGSEPPTRKDALGPFCSYREDALLWLEMPYFGDVVVYEEEPYSQRNLTSSYTADMAPRRLNSYDSGSATPNPQSAYMDSHTLSGSYDLATSSSASSGSSRELPSLVTVWDPDLNEDNPAERKYRRLARDILRGSIDPNLKPSRDEKARIELLLATPTDNLKNEDKDLLWKFRYTLTDNKKAVVKFLLSVDWKDELEVKQATDLLSQWCEIDIADALKLLGREKEFKHEIVRHFAVSTLATAKNEDLLDFLLQLVQALRYEKPGTPMTSSRGALSGDETGTVIQFQTVIPPSDQIAADGEGHHAPNLNQSMFGGSDSSIMRESLPTRMIGYLHNRDKEGPMYKFMVKNGDDLRQDQLIMQMFILMDRLLKKVNVDLKLTPYRILATGANDGLMEFVQDSYPVSYVVSHFESPQIVGFLRKHNPDPSAEFGIAPEALSTYVKSVAGYCVLTYLLGIGDRHLDNLMMKAEGHMFHIDFGFVFGADPKPYPPPFKLTKEMVEGMGGPTSEHYKKFTTYCCQAYNYLRMSADLILNLLSLMADSGIEELSANPATTLLKVEEKFRLDLTDEQAEQFFLGLINDSVSALFPLLVDWIHKVATKLK
ncbi:hypothetical protein BBJ29_008006 [Phytophthora kernoviae]|uniref:phosphatidylinositol 3-kinase n=1 Tax=Phytophthora kernoviae TaxID=325452 RepID=A0A3F2REK0_9STRA|nr:hypothetical protein BBP00_00008731 [Phytophthora kernoviae]RLN67260.1 hypothetical protein BBJ29_008006 [Phytophthora kernoviae]